MAVSYTTIQKFRASTYFLGKLYIYLVRMLWSKVHLQFHRRFLFQINAVLLNFLFIKKSLNRYIMIITKILSSRIVYSNSHVTLKTGEMFVENSALPSKEYILF